MCRVFAACRYRCLAIKVYWLVLSASIWPGDNIALYLIIIIKQKKKEWIRLVWVCVIVWETLWPIADYAFTLRSVLVGGHTLTCTWIWTTHRRQKLPHQRRRRRHRRCRRGRVWALSIHIFFLVSLLLILDRYGGSVWQVLVSASLYPCLCIVFIFFRARFVVVWFDFDFCRVALIVVLHLYICIVTFKLRDTFRYIPSISRNKSRNQINQCVKGRRSIDRSSNRKNRKKFIISQTTLNGLCTVLVPHSAWNE